MGKVCSLEDLTRYRTALRGQGRMVVMTNGCFDLLHVGHVRYLQQARSLGDSLVVAVNTDDSVRRLKGPGRPLQSEEDRAEILAALACVDYVVLFGEDTAEKIVATIQPDIYVKGGDYASSSEDELLHNLPEARIVYSYGGRVQLLPYVMGRSTTEIAKKIVRGGD